MLWGWGWGWGGSTPGLALYTLGTRRLSGFPWVWPLGLGKGKPGKPWAPRTVNGEPWGAAPGLGRGLPGSITEGKVPAGGKGASGLPGDLPRPGGCWGREPSTRCQVGEATPPPPELDSLAAQAVLGGRVEEEM